VSGDNDFGSFGGPRATFGPIRPQQPNFYLNFIFVSNVVDSVGQGLGARALVSLFRDYATALSCH